MYGKWLLILSNILVGGTGVVYGVMRYLLTTSDPYAIANHPWQPHFQHLHILTAPLLIFALGIFWMSHISTNLRSSGAKGRLSGITMLLTVVPMVMSGYFIQTAISEAWRLVWIWVHGLASLAWLVHFCVHSVRQSRISHKELV